MGAKQGTYIEAIWIMVWFTRFDTAIGYLQQLKPDHFEVMSWLHHSTLLVFLPGGVGAGRKYGIGTPKTCSRGTSGTQVSFNAAISACGTGAEWQLALKLLQILEENDVGNAQLQKSTALTSCFASAQEPSICWFSRCPCLCLGDVASHGGDGDDGDGDDGDVDDATVTSAEVWFRKRSQSKEGESVMIDSIDIKWANWTLNTLNQFPHHRDASWHVPVPLPSNQHTGAQPNTRKQHSFGVLQPGPRCQTPCPAMLSLVPARCELKLSTAKPLKCPKIEDEDASVFGGNLS